MYDSLQSQNRIRAIDPSAAIRIMIRQQAAVKNITLHQQAQDFSQASAILQSGSHQSLVDPTMRGSIIFSGIPDIPVPDGLPAAFRKSHIMLCLYSGPCAIEMADVAVLMIVMHLWQ